MVLNVEDIVVAFLIRIGAGIFNEIMRVVGRFKFNGWWSIVFKCDGVFYM